jgi:hypothetical protein
MLCPIEDKYRAFHGFAAYQIGILWHVPRFVDFGIMVDSLINMDSGPMRRRAVGPNL